MPALSEYSKVHKTVYNIITKKGYNLWYDEEREAYCAEKNGWDFMAVTPCSLLGIILIYEYKNPKSYQEYWWRDEDSLSEKNLSTQAPSYTSVVEKKLL